MTYDDNIIVVIDHFNGFWLDPGELGFWRQQSQKTSDT